ncbi:DUF4397 domain-containing protein [Mucilaginibacter paludis]|uniref:DUF4397 domain-containing protein n=1 Tax=Mucilaginibacter paludis DSM 18603 TaxID=714943 RepID=H1XZ29_9SPHI|nr:DUF4397 domain-containing protein [Mucilaginibacter paludis]EHQ24614.1 hypothetical protein Mucpa_0420 [Mucilaginibacter paludis DSM 18603]
MKTKYILILLTFVCLYASCKKEKTSIPLASINIINASTDVPALAFNFTATSIPWYKNQALIGYGSSAEYGIPSGNVSYNTLSSADTSKTLLHGTFNFKGGGIYSIYFTGTLPTIETVLLEDNIPVNQDSTSGVRFINLSPDAGPVTVTLQGGVDNEFSALNYKQISTFKKYPATKSITNNGGYNYEVKDAENNLIATFNWDPQVFKNNTVVISGLKSQTGIQVFQVNNY